MSTQLHQSDLLDLPDTSQQKEEKYLLATERIVALESTQATPYVKFNGKKGQLVIKGSSVSLDIFDFYAPILGLVDEYLLIENRITCHFYFEWFNTSTAKIIYDLLRHFNRLQKRGKSIKIYWFVNPSAEEMVETAQDFRDLFDLDFNIFEYR